VRWSLPLGRLFGIPIKVHFTFFFLLAYVYYEFAHNGKSHAAGLVAVALTCILFACVLAHEIGHSLVARFFGTRTRSIVLLPIGGVALLEQIPREPYKEILIALAGPFVSAVLAALFFAAGLAVQAEITLDFADITLGTCLSSLFLINAILVAFNLIPAFPMDGGRVFRGILSLAFGWERGTIWAVRVGQTLAFGFIVFSFFANHLGLLLVGFFILFGAGEEGRLTRIRAALEGAVAAHAMRRTFAVLSPDETLRNAVLKVVSCNQDDFPVVAGGALLGMARHDAMLQGLERHDPSTPIAEFVSTRFTSTEPGAPLEELYVLLARSDRRTIPVIDGGAIVGLLSLEQINRFAQLRRTLRGIRRDEKAAADRAAETYGEGGPSSGSARSTASDAFAPPAGDMT